MAVQMRATEEELAKELAAADMPIERLVQPPTTQEADADTTETPEATEVEEVSPNDVGPEDPPPHTDAPDQQAPEQEPEPEPEQEQDADTEGSEPSDTDVAAALESMFEESDPQQTSDKASEDGPQTQEEAVPAQQAAEQEVENQSKTQLEQGIQQFTLPEAPEFQISEEQHEAMLSSSQEMARTMKEYGDRVALNTTQAVLKQLLPLVYQVQTYANEQNYHMRSVLDKHPEWSQMPDAFDKACKMVARKHPQLPPHKVWPKIEEVMSKAIEQSGAITKGRRIDNRGPAKSANVDTGARQPGRLPEEKPPEDPAIAAFDRYGRGW